MAFKKFIQWVDHFNEKISLVHVILLSCLFAMISVVNHHGGILEHEIEFRLPFYLSDAPLLNKLFDSMILDRDMYQARELSYFLDFVDCKFIEFSIENGFPHFLSLTHYLFSIATGCLLWLFCVKELNLKPLFGIAWLVLFWTSPSIFLGGVFFRTAKMAVALLVAILFYVIYKVAVVSQKGNVFQISKKIWILYSMAVFLMVYLDQQGLFLTITALVFLTIWSFFVRNKNIYFMLLIGIASVLLHLLYKYTIVPHLTFMLNGYWPNFNYQTLPIQYFVKNLTFYLSAGFFLYVETFLFLIGNPPRIIGIGILLFFIFFPIVYLYAHPRLSANYRKFFTLAWIELLIISVLMVIIMYSFMVLRHPPLISIPGLIRLYYCLPTTVILAMTLVILTDIFCMSRISKWVVIIMMCFAIIGNVIVLNKDSQTRPAFLNTLKNLGSLNYIHERSIEENQVFQFFKSKKKNHVVGYSANVYVVKGIGFAERGRYQRAFEDFNKAIILKPDFAVAYYNRGVTYFKQDNIEMGCSDAQKACELGDCKLLEAANTRGLCR